ncbi:MAG: adenylate kinase [Leptolyngbyaceae cyanobacterium CSU_1_3]|nr:adenylate kinase [Leptolyngbyaceae cyanobacterium CSU_1_3]
MRLVILGGAGAGKGTQAELLHQKLGIPFISTGEILRTAIATQTELGKQVQSLVESGELVPDEQMIEWIGQRLTQPDITQGWLLEGYPRTAFQAEELDFLLDALHQRLDYAISLEVPDSILVERSRLRARTDDTPDILQRRLMLFHERTQPLLEYYQMRDRLLRVDGSQTVEHVQQEILKKLGH